MKTTGSILFILCTILLINCSKDEFTPPDCKVIPLFEDLSGRMEGGSGKGFILFSWKEGSFWSYALVPNLNISPAHDNVCEGNTTFGSDCLKQNLGFLAEGEGVYWGAYGSIKTIEGKNVKLRYPPEHVMDDIIKYCDEMNLDLVIMD